MEKQSKAMVNRLQKAKCKEQRQKESKKEKKKQLKQWAKAQAENVERMPSAERKQLRSQSSRIHTSRFGSMAEQEQAEF
jgi:hypothetical protein